MTDERHQLLKALVLEDGLPSLLEDIHDVCCDYYHEIKDKDPHLAEAWFQTVGALRYALRTLDFSGEN